MVPDDIESVESESVSDQELEQDVIEDEQDNCSSEDNLDEVMLWQSYTRNIFLFIVVL